MNIKLLIYLLLIHALQAKPLAHVNTMPKAWEIAPNLSICDFQKGKLLNERIIKGKRLNKDHKLLKNNKLNGKYLIIHNQTNFSGLYEVRNNKLIYTIRDVNQTFYLVYSIDEVKKFFAEKVKINKPDKPLRQSGK